jgi:UDPglucose--hexose-1-phosphate uridylyltransferase
MSVFRRDPTTNEWVILVPSRAVRPHRSTPGVRSPGVEFDAACPFCPGNERQTPPEISRRPASGEQWQVRVFSNLFPAVSRDGPQSRSGGSPFQEMRGRGAHEVVVESPRHDARLDQMSPEEVSEIVAVWRERYQALGRLQAVRAVIVFKNFGPGAGTSLLHAHSQILAVPVYPPHWMHALRVSMGYYDETGRNVYDDVVVAERAARIRVVAETDGFIAFCPFASTIPYEVWIMPTDRRSSFGALTDGEAPTLAGLLREMLGRLRAAAGDPDFNLVVYSAPAETPQGALFRWHLKILPRITLPAGFELGSGISINTMMPEDAAEALRTSPHG